LLGRPRRKVGTVHLGFPAIGIEVRYQHLMALGLEFPDGNVTQCAVERTRFRMSKNKQDFHGATPKKDDGTEGR
jgi:hypothetical protein